MTLQRRLSWWPNIEIMYSKSSELRNLFTDTLNKVTQMNHTPLRLSQVIRFMIIVVITVVDVTACLDQLLITIRSLLIVCDHVRSKTRLIMIITKLGIIYTAWSRNGVLSILSLPLQSTYMYKPINTASGERESGKMGSG